VVVKEKRLALILDLIARKVGHTQAQLLRNLRAHGYRVDQSTLSRDLAELGIRKQAGQYVLVTPVEKNGSPGPSDFSTVVRRFTPCGPHLVVINTVVGQAQPVAVAIDSVSEPAVAATLAGDDTVFVATKNRRTQTVVLRRFKQWFGEKHEN
jgi:transcriptional regulator of arginine metabolism